MTTIQRKLIFAAQMIGVIFCLLVAGTVPAVAESGQGLFTMLLGAVGARHMFTIGRPWGWGLLAFTGIGALVILLLPPKPKVITGLTAPIDLGF